MIVVCDTTPIRHLTAIGLVDLLPRLYASLIVPAAVWRELRAESTPADVKRSLEPRPAWMIVRSPAGLEADARAFASLDAGEREAIELAVELRADLLLMDDRDGRTLALSLGLAVTGTLGVLERAEGQRLLADLPSALEQLEGSGFYLSDRLRAAMLERHRLRRK
jgi:uncharacterized protein